MACISKKDLKKIASDILTIPSCCTFVGFIGLMIALIVVSAEVGEDNEKARICSWTAESRVTKFETFPIADGVSCRWEFDLPTRDINTLYFKGEFDCIDSNESFESVESCVQEYSLNYAVGTKHTFYPKRSPDGCSAHNPGEYLTEKPKPKSKNAAVLRAFVIGIICLAGIYGGLILISSFCVIGDLCSDDNKTVKVKSTKPNRDIEAPPRVVHHAKPSNRGGNSGSNVETIIYGTCAAVTLASIV